jgi:putative ABC transport system permease protein
VLSAVGMPPAGFRRLILIEACAVGVAGTVFGTLSSIALLEAFRRAFFVVVPYETALAFDWTAPLVYGAITLGVLLLAGAWPAWRASRLEVVEALRYE